VEHGNKHLHGSEERIQKRMEGVLTDLFTEGVPLPREEEVGV
jgi:hypothetical protein